MVKIMVVDDEPDVIETIKQGLDKLSSEYKIIGAESGEECLEKLKIGEIPDIILLDIMMPNLNGWQVYDLIQKNEKWSEIPIIFVTAKDDEETMKKGMKTNTYRVKKPFKIGELKEKIERVLSDGFSF